MDFQIDESKLLYGLGAFLGVVAIIYFGHELILDLSPTVKSFILLSGTAMFLGTAEYVRESILKSSFYIFSAFSYLSFLVYIFARFGFSSEQVFLILAASSAIFIGLGYARSAKGYGLDEDQARKLLGGVIAVLAVLVVFDVMGPQPEYSLELHETVEVVEGVEFEVGVFEIRNDFLLSRNVDVPSFRGCLSISEEHNPRPVFMSPGNRDLIGGGTVERLSLNDTVGSRPDENVTVSGTYSIERGECPSEPEDMTIYIDDASGSGIFRSVAD